MSNITFDDIHIRDKIEFMLIYIFSVSEIDKSAFNSTNHVC